MILDKNLKISSSLEIGQLRKQAYQVDKAIEQKLTMFFKLKV